MGLLGAHVSIAGGVENAVSHGVNLGCEAIQIFSKNQRQWKSPPLKADSVDAFQHALEMSPIQTAVIHDSYLINLAGPDAEMLAKSRTAFCDEMARADRLGVPYLVFHPGSHKGSGEAEGIRRIAESLNEAISQQPEGRVQLLLEITAGMGDHLGGNFQQLANIITAVDRNDRLGVCFDTAHAFAAGYDMRTESDYHQTFSMFDHMIGLDRLKAFHLNDSMVELGSRKDRHEQIGKGFLGETPFRLLVNDERFRAHPMLLETPGGDVYFKNNLERLRSFIQH